MEYFFPRLRHHCYLSRPLQSVTLVTHSETADNLILSSAQAKGVQKTEEALLHISRLKLRKAGGTLETPNSLAIATRSLVFVTSRDISNLQKAAAKKDIKGQKALRLQCSFGKAKPTSSDRHQPGLCIFLCSDPLKSSPLDSLGSWAWLAGRDR